MSRVVHFHRFVTRKKLFLHHASKICLFVSECYALPALAQRVYIMNNGHIVHEGPTHQLRAQPRSCSAISAFSGSRGGSAVPPR
jgi:ABC-type branched-subunit amino acid transport system ATPase component